MFTIERGCRWVAPVQSVLGSIVMLVILFGSSFGLNDTLIVRFLFPVMIILMRFSYTQWDIDPALRTIWVKKHSQTREVSVESIAQVIPHRLVYPRVL